MPAGQATLPLLHRFLGIGQLVLAAVAILVFRPRVSARGDGQSVEQFWATPEIATKVVPVWFLLEGAGVLSAVGYFCTGEFVSAIATGLAIVACLDLRADALRKRVRAG